MPKISIIVPVYNTEKYINRCIDSILAQTFTDFECILVDDYSSDGCPIICDKYAENDNRIKTIHNKNNIGSSLSRKIGFDISSGEYIIFFDADDYVEVNIIEKMYLKAIDQDYDMVYCDYYFHDKSNNTLYKKVPILSNNFIMNIKNSVLGLNIGGVVWNKLIKRSIYEKVEFPKDEFAEDKYIITQVLFFSNKIGYVNSALYHYQYNQESISYNSRKEWDRYTNLLNNYRRVFDFFKKNIENNMSVFEPEMSMRLKYLNEMHPRNPKRLIKKVFRFLIPTKILC